MKQYIQVGVTAIKKPSGEHMSSIPLYIEVDSLEKSGLTTAQESDLRGISGFFIKEYGKRLREQNGRATVSNN